jgi:hypothetical protein
MGAGLATAIAAPAWADDAVFKLVSISLYLPHQAMAERGPTSDELTAYIAALTDAAKAALAAAPKQAAVSSSIVVGLKAPGRSRVWIVGGGLEAQRALAGLMKTPLEAVRAPPVSGWNAFALNFDAWGGAGAPVAAMPIPDEWRLAMQAQGGGMLPDDALKAVWPN